jgi:metallo-beta-lactamase family protein
MPPSAQLHTIGGLSPHADRDGLTQWLRGFAHAPGRCFVVHGEHETGVSFGDTLRGKLGWTQVDVPQRDAICSLD